MADDNMADLLHGEGAAGAATASRAGSCGPFDSDIAEADAGDEASAPVEEFVLDEHETADTTALQAQEGQDLQGIPWDRLQVVRDTYRQQRQQQYLNYTNCIAVEQWTATRQQLTAGWPQPAPLAQQNSPYMFLRNWRAVQSSIIHFQLRNLLSASTAHDVFLVYDNRVQHWNCATRRVSDVLDLRGVPKGPRLPGVGRVQVSTMCMSGELLAAGGFTGELVIGRLYRAEEWTCGTLSEHSEEASESESEDSEMRGQQDEGEQQHLQQQAARHHTLMPAPQQQSRYRLHEGSSQQCLHGQSCATEWQAVWSQQPMQQLCNPVCQHHHMIGCNCPQLQVQQSATLQKRQQQSKQPQQEQDRQLQQQQCEQQCEQQWPFWPHAQQQQRTWNQQQQQQQHQWSPRRQPLWWQQHRHHDISQQHEPLLGAAGPAAAEVLHSCRVAQSENGITNGIEIFNSCSYGHCVMTSNNDCCVRLFDIEGCRPRQRLSFPWAVNYSTLRPAGAGLGGGVVVAVVGDDPVTSLMDCTSGLEVMKLRGHKDFSFAAAWHPDGQMLATGNQDGTTRVWDIRNYGAPLAVLAGTMGAIRSLRFSPDGNHLAAAEMADFVHIYDTKSGFTAVQEIDVFGEVAGISLSPDSQSFFVAISDTLYSSLLQYQLRQRQ